MKTYAFIFARGGSKGVTGKNTRLLGGIPLLAHSIKLAQQISQIEEVFVSTEDKSITEVAQNWGAKVIPRPAELAQDTSPEWLAWQHAVEWVIQEKGEFDVFVSLPATSPLRNRDDVENCLNRFDEDSEMVVTVTVTSRSPWFNMIQVTKDGYAHLLIEGEKHYERCEVLSREYVSRTAKEDNSRDERSEGPLRSGKTLSSCSIGRQNPYLLQGVRL